MEIDRITFASHYANATVEAIDIFLLKLEEAAHKQFEDNPTDNNRQFVFTMKYARNYYNRIEPDLWDMGLRQGAGHYNVLNGTAKLD